MTSPRRTFSYLQSGHGRFAQTRAQSLHLSSHGLCAARGGLADALRAQPPQATRRHVGFRGAIELNAHGPGAATVHENDAPERG